MNTRWQAVRIAEQMMGHRNNGMLDEITEQDEWTGQIMGHRNNGMLDETTEQDEWTGQIMAQITG